MEQEKFTLPGNNEWKFSTYNQYKTAQKAVLDWIQKQLPSSNNSNKNNTSSTSSTQPKLSKAQKKKNRRKNNIENANCKTLSNYINLLVTKNVAVPSWILSLLTFVIKKRAQVHLWYTSITSHSDVNNKDLANEISQANETHKFWIDMLKSWYFKLRKLWLSQNKQTSNSKQEKSTNNNNKSKNEENKKDDNDDDDDDDDVITQNIYSILENEGNKNIIKEEEEIELNEMKEELLQQQYQAQRFQEKRLQEKKLDQQSAAINFIMDYYKLILRIERIWFEYKTGQCNLVTATVVTVAAIRLASSLEAELVLQIPKFEDTKEIFLTIGCLLKKDDKKMTLGELERYIFSAISKIADNEIASGNGSKAAPAKLQVLLGIGQLFRTFLIIDKMNYIIPNSNSMGLGVNKQVFRQQGINVDWDEHKNPADSCSDMIGTILLSLPTWVNWSKMNCSIGVHTMLFPCYEILSSWFKTKKVNGTLLFLVQALASSSFRTQGVIGISHINGISMVGNTEKCYEAMIKELQNNIMYKSSDEEIIARAKVISATGQLFISEKSKYHDKSAISSFILFIGAHVTNSFIRNIDIGCYILERNRLFHALAHCYHALRERKLIKDLPIMELLIQNFEDLIFVGGAPKCGNFFRQHLIALGVKAHKIDEFAKSTVNLTPNEYLQFAAENVIHSLSNDDNNNAQRFQPSRGRRRKRQVPSNVAKYKANFRNNWTQREQFSGGGLSKIFDIFTTGSIDQYHIEKAERKMVENTFSVVTDCDTPLDINTTDDGAIDLSSFNDALLLSIKETTEEELTYCLGIDYVCFSLQIDAFFNDIVRTCGFNQAFLQKNIDLFKASSYIGINKIVAFEEIIIHPLLQHLDSPFTTADTLHLRSFPIQQFVDRLEAYFGSNDLLQDLILGKNGYLQYNDKGQCVFEVNGTAYATTAML